LDASGQFGPVTVKHYAWTERHTTAQYLDLLRTYSPIHNLDDGLRRDLLAAIGDLVEASGGQVEGPATAVLYLARVQR
jgi:hypothetical protein